MSDRRWVRGTARIGMVAGVMAWLWPIGLGGRMPVGGDATQFSMGLMAFLRSSLLAGRLPLWNDLWGFGFPGLAESQMGVYYPPHWLLYGLLPTEVASVTSLVLHACWAALGANWAARRFGASEVGAAVAGFAFATCGFFLIHLPHSWGATVGSWMPWAWGLAWTASRGEGTRRTPWVLSAVLALQVLPGHFQLAFVTEVGCLALAVAGGGRSGGVFLAVAGMIPLSALQLWPTLRLAELSQGRRDFVYLSGFAAAPLHFVSYAAPGLFHRSPLWRPIAWDPFHTSPEELLGYVGLVPLFLAFGAVARGWRGDPGVRALAMVAGLTVVLSLGPYAPGFGWLIRLPGFSFFRAPARWGLGTNLALALLAARGFDLLPAWPRAGRSAFRFSAACTAWVVAVVLGFELAIVASSGVMWAPVASGFDRLGAWSPWGSRPGERSFAEVMAEARRPRTDLLPEPGDEGPGEARRLSLEGRRFAIYRRELGEAGALLAALAAAGLLGSRPRAFGAALVAIALADPLILARHRPFELGPARPLVGQSPVLAALARGPRGARTLDPAQNLLMVSGVDPAWAYRTLDLPAPIGLLQLARRRQDERQAGEALRIAGVDVVIALDASKLGGRPISIEPWAGRLERLNDPALAGWIFGDSLARVPGFGDFAVLRSGVPASRAWLVPSTDLGRVDGMADPLVLLDRFRDATPLPSRSEAPERVEVTVDAVDSNPATVVLSSTFDPEWGAYWTAPSGESKPAEVVKVFGGWQGVAVAGRGRWTLHLEYSGRAARIGLAASALAWVAWLAAFVRLGAKRGPGSAILGSEREP